MFTLNKIASFICLSIAVAYTYFANKFSTMLTDEYGLSVDIVYPTEMGFVIGFWIFMAWVLYRVVSRKF